MLIAIEPGLFPVGMVAGVKGDKKPDAALTLYIEMESFP